MRGSNSEKERLSVCVCVCVCERERERECEEIMEQFSILWWAERPQFEK